MRSLSLFLIGICFVLGVAAVSAPADQDTSDAALHGAGATYPAPLYQKWFQQYRQTKGVSIDYQAIGSGGGISSLKQSKVDFAASDVAVSPADIQSLPGTIIQIPMVGRVVAITYNLPTLKGRLRMTGDILADIYLGKIKRWNDPRVARINPALNLPPIPILPIHISEGGADTYYFTSYLSQSSPRWKSQVGSGKFIHWPVGLGGRSGGWGGLMERAGAIGYIDLHYIQQIGYPCCALKNQSGGYVVPSLATASAALTATVPRLRRDIGALMLNAPGRNAYPIVGYTYLLIPKQSRSPAEKQDLMRLLRFMLDHGQKAAMEWGEYVPLPDAVVNLDRQLLSQNEIGPGL